MITDLLTKSFDDIIEPVDYTRSLEDDLDADRAGKDRSRAHPHRSSTRSSSKDLARAARMI